MTLAFSPPNLIPCARVSRHGTDDVGTARIYLWVAIGSALGGVARYACSSLTLAWLGGGLPWDTIFINFLGSFVIGLFATLSGPHGAWPAAMPLRPFVMVGICGGYTTFSAFSLQTLQRLQAGEALGAVANIGLSVIFCLVAVWAGDAIARHLNRGIARA